MDFRITGLSPEPFVPLYGLSAVALAGHGVRRVFADRRPGFPDRVELRDGAPGEPLLLLNYMHLPVTTPYRCGYAIYVLEGACQRYERVNQVPDVMRSRVMSLRAFDREDMLCDADIVSGDGLEALIERLFAGERTAYVHAHYAKPGCFAARIDRA